MDHFEKVPIEESYRLLNHGPVLLLSTKDPLGKFNLAPIAWSCPLETDPARILLVMDPGHQSYQNFLQSKELALCLPHRSQAQIVRDLGSVSGRDEDKYEKFEVPFFLSERLNLRIPKGIIGFLESRLLETIEREGIAIVIAETLNAFVSSGLYTKRLLVEKERAKTLHHLGGGTFMTPGDQTC